MDSNKCNCAGPSSGSFLVGILAGVAVGLLVAPQAGKKTRALIKQKLGTMGDTVHEDWDELKSKGENALHNLESKAISSANRAKRSVRKIKVRAGRAFKAAEKELKKPS